MHPTDPRTDIFRHATRLINRPVLRSGLLLVGTLALCGLLFFILGIHSSSASTVTSVVSQIGESQSAALRMATAQPTSIAPAAVDLEPAPIEVTRPERETTYTTIAATGDVMISRMVRLEAEGRGSYTWPFEHVQELLSEPDISIVNLENPILPECPKRTETMVFCMPAAAVEGLSFAGIDIATIANNHSYDKGVEGYDSTVDALEAAGIHPSDPDRLVIMQRGETTFGFIGFNRIRQYPDTPVLPTMEVLARIEAAEAQVDVLIVSFHWGIEYTTVVDPPQREIARAAIRAGADVILGHHPHIIQPIEEYRGVPIFYSLGNFVFDNMSAVGPRAGWVVKLEFSDDRLVSYEIVETMIYDYGQPRIEDWTP